MLMSIFEVNYIGLVDGNKRTAMLTGLTFLEINKLIFVAKPEEIEDFVAG